MARSRIGWGAKPHASKPRTHGAASSKNARNLQQRNSRSTAAPPARVRGTRKQFFAKSTPIQIDCYIDGRPPIGALKRHLGASTPLA
jgi:hypothetical protein